MSSEFDANLSGRGRPAIPNIEKRKLLRVTLSPSTLEAIEKFKNHLAVSAERTPTTSRTVEAMLLKAQLAGNADILNIKKGSDALSEFKKHLKKASTGEVWAWGDLVLELICNDNFRDFLRRMSGSQWKLIFVLGTSYAREEDCVRFLSHYQDIREEFCDLDVGLLVEPKTTDFDSNKEHLTLGEWTSNRGKRESLGIVGTLSECPEIRQILHSGAERAFLLSVPKGDCNQSVGMAFTQNFCASMSRVSTTGWTFCDHQLTARLRVKIDKLDRLISKE